MLDDGRLTDGKGRTVDFRNTVIIMTSNLGAESIGRDRSMGFGRQEEEVQNYEKMKERVMDQIKTAFRPEFLNRLDDVIVFHHLTKAELKQIFELLIKDLRKRIEDQGFQLEVSDEAREMIIQQGYNPDFGARPLKRAIQRNIENVASEEILKKTVVPGDTLKIVVDGDKIQAQKG